jgi:L-seryl-tRNA(Ser) seleniumtransferase
MRSGASSFPLQEALRQIPSVDQVLGSAGVRALLDAEPRPVVVRAVRAALDAVRAEVRAADGAAAVPPLARIAADVVERVRTRPRGLRRVLNATGIVLHTNLGRARLAEEAVRALAESAPGACDLELDLETGRRGSRTARLERRLTEITGAEAAFVVNNNAAALVLALNELAQGREAIVSRGELVEIGGSFRLPEVMARTGAKLVEVGTTNRTHLRDYEAAIGPETALLLKVHRSNFRQDGFVAEPALAELAELGARRGVPVLHDLGSGLLHPVAATRDEPRLTDSLRAGVDVVTMSGDKLLGGPQAGILLGKAAVLDRLRRNPLARAVRVDKFTIAALAATLDLLEDADRARARIPVLRALAAAPEELAARASAIAGALAGCPDLQVRLVAATSEVGGGAVPAAGLPTTAVALRHAALSADELAAELRGLDLPVIGRIAEGEVRLDPRSLDPAEDPECARVIRDRFGSTGRRGEG